MAGWRALIDDTGKNLPFRTVFVVYGGSALAKYLPGNLLHIVGRQILGNQHDLDQRAMMAASLAEILLVISAGCLLSAAAWPFSGIDTLGIYSDSAIAIILLVAGCGGVGLCLAVGRIDLPLLRRLRLPVLPFGACILACGCLLVFILGGAMVMALFQAYALPSSDQVPLAALLLAYGLGYVVGFITPGSPGGVGIREAALIALLTPMAGPAVPVMLAVGQRLAWILAELALFGIAALLARRP